ncbi:MAG: DUF3466 family protein [Acidobacteriaceae bacterium]|nr:DUF3466 family protein [Acidobacteriaceae bacterium]
MKLRPTLHYVLWALLLGGAHTLTADILYTVTDLGTLGGGSSYGNAINNAGQVTGYSTFRYGEQGMAIAYRAFLYSNGQMTKLDTLIDPALGIRLNSANAINDNGQIVANSIGGHAYLLTPVPEPRTWALLGLSGLILLAKLHCYLRP